MSANTLANRQNQEALAEVWASYQSRLYRKAFRQLGSREDAEDALQDALLCALKGIHWFRGESNLSTWLYSIVINSARGIMRQRLRRDVLSLDEQCWGEEHTWADLLQDSAPRQDEIYAGTELSETFELFLQRLPAAQRQVCSLRARDGLSLKEIAQRLRIPEGTAKARFSRGRAKLVRLMSKARRAPASSRGHGSLLTTHQAKNFTRVALARAPSRRFSSSQSSTKQQFLTVVRGQIGFLPLADYSGSLH